MNLWGYEKQFFFFFFFPVICTTYSLYIYIYISVQMTVKELTLEKLKNKIIRIARHINGDDFHARRFCFGSLFSYMSLEGSLSWFPFFYLFFFSFLCLLFFFSFSPAWTVEQVVQFNKAGPSPRENKVKEQPHKMISWFSYRKEYQGSFKY